MKLTHISCDPVFCDQLLPWKPGDGEMRLYEMFGYLYNGKGVCNQFKTYPAKGSSVFRFKVFISGDQQPLTEPMSGEFKNGVWDSSNS